MLSVVTTIAEFRIAHAALSGDLGLVTTMGYLHQGHLHLVERAKAENKHVAVSIFVNPTQFGPNEDFTAYPRDPEHDLDLLRSAGVDLVFIPPIEEIYPAGFQTYVEVTGVSQGLEGERRPGHFRGVATVVTKLFNIIQPKRAYFGQKDAQQVTVIRRMVTDLAIPVEIVVVPTVRDRDGLALSSRNSYLSPQERQAAPILHAALTHAQSLLAAGETSGEKLRATMREVIAREPLARADYVSAADADTLQELDVITTQTRSVLLSLAVYIGKTRLIDNLLVDKLQ